MEAGSRWIKVPTPEMSRDRLTHISLCADSAYGYASDAAKSELASIGAMARNYRAMRDEELKKGGPFAFMQQSEHALFELRRRLPIAFYLYAVRTADSPRALPDVSSDFC